MTEGSESSIEISAEFKTHAFAIEAAIWYPTLPILANRTLEELAWVLPREYF